MDRVPAMTTEPQYKSLRVSPETHRKIHDLAAKLNGSADEALAFLLGLSTVRVPVSPEQRARWQAAADNAGQQLGAFVEARVEGALMYGGDPYGLQLIYEHVRALTQHAGVQPIRVVQADDPRTRAHP